MITAERRATDVPAPPRLRPERGLEGLQTPEAKRSVAALEETAGGTAVVAALDLEHTGDGTGLLVAFVVTTLVMVIGVIALAILQSWWLLVPVVLVHWIATFVILARINGLLSQ